MSRTYASTCSYCGVGCGLQVRKDRTGRLRVEGDPEHPVNRGMLCSKGMNLGYAMEDQGDRLHYPELRPERGRPTERVGWSRAMEHAAATFRSLIDRHGPDSVGFYVSGQCLTEEYYLANKLVKGFLGTNNIDTNSRLCMSSAVAAHTRMFGEDSVPISYDDIGRADCFLIAGANPAWCHPILYRRIERHKAENPGVKIIVADPRKTESCDAADLHLPLAPGTDIHLFNGIARVLIEDGRVDPEFLANHVDGYPEYRDSILSTGLEEAARSCGLDPAAIRQAATWIGDADGFLAMWAMGLNQSAVGVDKNLALMSLNLITGQIGRPGSGPFSLTGQPNAMGGREVGGMASLLAAHRNLADPRHRREVAEFWGVESIRDTPGLTATEMFDALGDGRMKAIWIIGTNPMVSLPDVNRAEESLEKAEFVVVQDISRRSDTLRHADLILPAAGHFEKAGTMTNSERRISYLEKIVDPPGEALSDAEILIRFARAMGFDGFDFPTVAAVFEEHARLTKGTNIDISGLTHEELGRRGPVQWPWRKDAPEGTARLFADRRFHTPNGKARLHPIRTPTDDPDPSDPELPLVLTTGRIRDQWHTMTKTGKVNRLRQHIPHPFLQIHPDDASTRDIGDGDVVRVWNGRGEVRVHARTSEEMRSGVVFLPMHWGRIGEDVAARANNLTSERLDPVSKEPDFKFSRVEVAKVTPERRKVVLVGAGAAAYGFLRSARELESCDEIHVFSNEPHPFYDRVLLPEYVNERRGWADLLKVRGTEMEGLDVRLHPSTEIRSIDRDHRTVTDRRGVVHSYDVLIVATGSRAFVPPDVPIDSPGVFTMRNRHDADGLKKRLRKGGHVLIAGGGLLGLELAAALNEIGIGITIVERGERLMKRQLDLDAAELLRQFVEERGIHVHLDEEVEEITAHPSRAQHGVWTRLGNGRSLYSDAVVYAIGTRPEVDLLSAADILCDRGVVVDDQLRTSDPNVYAIGEIAEHRGQLHGITAAAERQGSVLARHLAGDPLAAYAGSVAMNILKFPDLDLCSVGLPVVPDGATGYEEVLFVDRSEYCYKKCIIKDDRLVGAILMGDRAEFPELRELIESGTELGDLRRRVLRGNVDREPVEGRVVCSCGRVGEGNLERLIEQGCSGMDELCNASGAGIGCGSCKPEIQRILDRALPVPRASAVEGRTGARL